MMTRLGPKEIFDMEKDIEYFSVVDGVVDVFILLGGRQPSIAGPLENDGVGVLQTGSPGHCINWIPRLQINYFIANGCRRYAWYKNNRRETSGNYGKAGGPNVRNCAIANRLKRRYPFIISYDRQNSSQWNDSSCLVKAWYQPLKQIKLRNIATVRLWHKILSTGGSILLCFNLHSITWGNKSLRGRLWGIDVKEWKQNGWWKSDAIESFFFYHWNEEGQLEGCQMGYVG